MVVLFLPPGPASVDVGWEGKEVLFQSLEGVQVLMGRNHHNSVLHQVDVSIGAT